MTLGQEKKLKVVVLDCVYDSWSDARVRHFFADVLALRFEGYGREYPRHVIPADNSDYFGTHLVTCEEHADGSLTPISSYKMVSLKRCMEFKREFVGIQVPKAAGALEHAEVISEVVRNCQRQGIDLGYSCSWTIHPSIRKNEVLTKLVRNLVYTTHINWQRDFQVPQMIIAGVTRFKADAYQETYNYQRLKLNGKVLGSFGHADLAEEQVVMLHLQDLSDYAKKICDRYQSYWDTKLVLTPQTKPSVQEEQEDIQKAA